VTARSTGGEDLDETLEETLPAGDAPERGDWEVHRRFGEVPAYNGPRLAAPDLVRLAAPNPSAKTLRL
jgi:hypothetical protein